MPEPHVAVHRGTWILVWGGSIRETVGMMVIRGKSHEGGAELLCYLCCGEQCLLQISAGQWCACSRWSWLQVLLVCVCFQRCEKVRLLKWPSFYPDEEDLAWVGAAKGSRWCSLLIWHKAGVAFLSPVLDEPGRACDSPYSTKIWLINSELRSYPRCAAAFVLCEAEHPPGEEDLSAPAGRVNACLRQWKLRVLVPLNWVCWKKPSPVRDWFYA